MIPSLLAGLRLKESPWHDELMAEWKTLIGPPICKHTRPGRIQNTTLVVFIDTPVWMGEISRLGKTRILAAIQKRFGPEKITAIQLLLDPGEDKTIAPRPPDGSGAMV
jgi:hypothetical protein